MDLLSTFDFRNGKIVYNDFKLVTNRSLEEQQDLLKEDLLIVKYPNNLFLKVYHLNHYSKHPLGMFKVNLVQSPEWFHPIFDEETPTLLLLPLLIEKGIILASR